MSKKPIKKENSEGTGVAISLPIESHDDHALVVFADNMLVQIDEHECHLSFYEIKPPLVIKTSDEKKSRLPRLKSIPARCVVRVVISRKRLKTFAEALQGGSDADDDIRAGRIKSFDSAEEMLASLNRAAEMA